MSRLFNLFGCWCALSLGTASAQLTVKPLQDRTKWTYGDPDAWEWGGSDLEPVLTLKKQSNFKPAVRSPFNLAWFSGGEWASFTLTAEVRLEAFDRSNNDVCIAFAKSGDTKFYYAHLGETADAVHLQIHIVDQADRRSITEKGAAVLPWKPDTWHKVKLERDADAGTILVYFDGVEVLRANDKTLGKGQIGLGSFDDLGSFRDVEISPKP